MMQNGYFQLVNDLDGYGIAVYQPHDGGDFIRLGEILGYLDSMGIDYDRKKVEMQVMDESDGICHIGKGPCPVCPESYQLIVSDDSMTAYVRFIPPSETGRRMTINDFMKDLKFRNITFGLKPESMQMHFNTSGVYCTDLLIAQGEEPIQGKDARLEYCFNTNVRRRPALREDGTVDYFNLTIINQCRKGDMLARIIPEEPGIAGHNIYGEEIKPRDVRQQQFKYGRNIEISEDKLFITSAVDGHVSLIDGQIFVADVYRVKDVDISTGNLDYEGSIQIDGNVAANYEVKAGGNVIVNGLVEGARIVAGGNIIISKGMNGMQKGVLKAGGNVVVKFLENTRVAAGGYVETEAILHSKVSAGSEIRVLGRKGVIIGGHVQAGEKVMAKTIGGDMGASTTIEVGVNPIVKAQYIRLQQSMEELKKAVEEAEVIMNSFKDKMSMGVPISDAQLKYMKSVSKILEDKGLELEHVQQQIERFKTMMEAQKQGEVVINNIVFPGTTIVVGDISRTMQSEFHYCKFIKEKGEITLKPM